VKSHKILFKLFRQTKKCAEHLKVGFGRSAAEPEVELLLDEPAYAIGPVGIESNWPARAAKLGSDITAPQAKKSDKLSKRGAKIR
jgi:hypothetical protein